MSGKLFWRLTTIAILVVGLGFAFNNCTNWKVPVPPPPEEKVELPSTSPYVKYCPVAVSAQPKATDSPRANMALSPQQQGAGALSASGAEVKPKLPDYFFAPASAGAFTAETEFLVMASNKCLRANPAQSFLSEQIVSLGLREEMDVFAYKIKFSPAKSLNELEQAANQDSCILALDFNQTLSTEAVSLPNDPVYISPGMPNLSTIGLSDIYGTLYNLNNGINETVRVAVIDTGVDVNHPDLKENILHSDTGHVIGYNPMAGYDPNDVYDSKFHGTHVAGTIAASTNNNLGVAGVMGKFVKILPIKVSVDGTAVDMDAVVNGIYWAVEQDVDVINMSLGGLTSPPPGSGMIYGELPVPQTFKDAVKYAIDKGITLVVAAGNNGLPLGGSTIYEKRSSSGALLYRFYNNQYPAILGKDYEGLITVGSIDGASFARSTFSNYSSLAVEMMAPGSVGCTVSGGACSGIFSTVPSFLAVNGYANGVKNSDGTTSPIVGTSMASPVVAGATALAIGLARSRGYDVYPELVEQILATSAVSKSTLTSFAKSGRAIDLRTLVQYIDQQSNLSIDSTQDRNDAYGAIQILTQPVAQQEVLEGERAQISVTLTGASVKLVSYQWYKNNRPIYGANRPTLIIEKAALSDGAQYYVMVRAGTNELQSTRSDLIVVENCAL